MTSSSSNRIRRSSSTCPPPYLRTSNACLRLLPRSDGANDEVHCRQIETVSSHACEPVSVARNFLLPCVTQETKDFPNMAFFALSRRAGSVAKRSAVGRCLVPAVLEQQQTRTFSDQFNKHRHTPDNNDDTVFDFTPENYDKVNIILSKYPENYKASATIPLLDLAQRQNDNFLTLKAMDKVAELLDMAPMRVYEVATFYTMFNREKVGKYFIQLCGTTPCMICGSEEIKQTICDHLGIVNNETTKDGLFTLREVECLGACSNAPMVQLNDDFYENLTPETTRQLLDACAAGKPPPLTKWGSLPMNGQLSCEGPQGKNSLFDPPHKPGFGFRKDFDDLPKMDPADVKNSMGY